MELLRFKLSFALFTLCLAWTFHTKAHASTEAEDGTQLQKSPDEIKAMGGILAGVNAVSADFAAKASRFEVQFHELLLNLQILQNELMSQRQRYRRDIRHIQSQLLAALARIPTDGCQGVSEPAN